MKRQKSFDQAYLYELQQLLAQHFNLQELRTLTLRVNIEFEDLGGEGRSNKARELVLVLARQNRLPEFIGILGKERPLVPWPPLPENFYDAPGLAQDTSKPMPDRRLLAGIGLGVGLLIFILFRVYNGPAEWQDIPGGTAILGRPDRFCTQEVEPFQIQSTEVRNRDYQACVSDEKCDPLPLWEISEAGWTYPPDEADYPAHNLTWHEADAYCRYIGARLPTEAEWVFAARGNSTANYPWGDAFDGSLANLFESDHRGVIAVDLNGDRCSEQEVCDLIGNAREWVLDTTIDACDTSAGAGQHITKGGAFPDSAADITIWTRFQIDEQPYAGVRCVRDD